MVKNVGELTEKVYPDISNISTKLVSRKGYTITHWWVNWGTKDFIVSKFEASSQTYYSVDTVVDGEEAVHYPTEFLNYLTPSGIPQHKLILKVGSPIILQRH